jgi:hypothetical protein
MMDFKDVCNGQQVLDESRMAVGKGLSPVSAPVKVPGTLPCGMGWRICEKRRRAIRLRCGIPMYFWKDRQLTLLESWWPAGQFRSRSA